LTMALGVHAAQVSARRALLGYLGVTALLGGVFMVIKAYEYYDHIIHGLVPGAGFTSELDPRGALFFFLYFMMTGIHAVHLIIGIVILLVLMVRARTGRYEGESFTPIELMGMYWHFVDVVWVFLFPLLYLIGRH
ncbi:MAG: cytochrome c oxidase subunit 3, partial [Ardenticatenales bacterium]|nr:cytochrome c oxidase subunit 3 [Ardenticatenales bacterium]